MNSDVVKWLESPDGEKWSRQFHIDSSFHLPAVLIQLKDDVNPEQDSYLWYR